MHRAAAVTIPRGWIYHRDTFTGDGGWLSFTRGQTGTYIRLNTNRRAIDLSIDDLTIHDYGRVKEFSNIVYAQETLQIEPFTPQKITEACNAWLKSKGSYPTLTEHDVRLLFRDLHYAS